MLSQLDNIIFPDRCDVLEVAAQRYVYPIFKNGSSSLNKSGFRRLGDNEIAQLKQVDVFVRDPYERFLSGVQTYLRYNSHLDRKTTLHFAANYLFLDRHFCPQLHWLVNLARQVPGIKIRLLPLTELNQITTAKENAYHQRDAELVSYFANNQKVQFYLQLDKVLTENLLGQTVTIQEIFAELRKSYPELYQEVVQRSIDLCTVLE